MKQNAVLVALAVAIALACTGCFLKTNTSKINHDLGSPFAHDSAVQWHNTTRADFLTFVSPNIFWSATAEDYLADEHPAVVRLQAWINAVDGLLRKEYPEEFKRRQVPKPQVMLAREPAMAAYVQKISLCYDIPFVFLGTQTDKRPSSDKGTGKGAYPRALGFTNGRLVESDLCLKTVAGTGELTKVVDFINSSQSDCRLTHSRKSIDLQNGCVKATKGPWQDFSHSESFITTRVSSRVPFSTGALALLGKEEHFLFVLFHELGHYYRAHTLQAPDRMRFFYNQENTNSKHKPKPDAGAASKGFEISLLSGIPEVTVQPDQKLRPELAKLIALTAQITPEVCSHHVCAASCKGLAEEVALPKKEQMLPLSQKRAEEKFLACAAALATGEGPGKLTPTRQTQLIEQALGEKVRAAIQDIPVGKTLADTVQLMEAPLKALQVRRNALPALLTDNKLGWYTEEQEADDIAMELMAKMGFAPEVTVEAQLAQVDYLDSIGRKQEVSGEECRRLAAAGWKDKKRQPVKVPLGGLNDTHHASCYRAYNLAKESPAHGYKVASRTLEPLDAAAWKRLQDSLPQ